ARQPAGTVLDDGAVGDAFARRQCRQRIARTGQPPNVASALSGQAGRASADRAYHEWRASPGLDEGNSAQILAPEIQILGLEDGLGGAGQCSAILATDG